MAKSTYLYTVTTNPLRAKPKYQQGHYKKIGDLRDLKRAFEIENIGRHRNATKENTLALPCAAVASKKRQPRKTFCHPDTDEEKS
ncbi:hypothetical protein TIFTF001_000381 [Ficus carica]|uniref:Uncharacterized protein n=1 Tax=Ficus carica TaxID=3494 RepID=A0AA87ZA98_FICCA|nr:hypothetical protein TIFTF001_000381 [Ficus carica]